MRQNFNPFKLIISYTAQINYTEYYFLIMYAYFCKLRTNKWSNFDIQIQNSELEKGFFFIFFL